MAAVTTETDRDFAHGFRLALALHVGVALAIIIKTVVFPGTPVLMMPTLRVDIVGLPDILKKDLVKVTKAPPAVKQEAVKPPPRVKETKPVEMAKPSEMVLKPKHQTSEVKREKNMRSALDRIKALEDISDDDKSQNKSPSSVVIKGNKVSKGMSLSSDARESDQASYYDTLRDQLQSNWELPPWIARQNYSAQVQIFIDSTGHLRSFRFVRPSGNSQFDDAVKKAIAQSQPFAPPPDDIASSLLANGILVGFPL